MSAARTVWTLSSKKTARLSFGLLGARGQTTTSSTDGAPHAAPTSLAEEFLSPECTQQQIADALKPHYDDDENKARPVILRNALSTSDACQRWSDMDYLKRTVGEDSACEVEIGSTYSSDGGVVRSEIAFGDYVDYVRLVLHAKQNNEKVEEVAYLAQNDIFPELLPDLTIPSLCSDASYNIGNGKLYSTMIWFGPAGCVSPLHYDPMDNLFIQIVGSKRVMLYSPYPSRSQRKQQVDPLYILKDTGKNCAPEAEEEEEENWFYPGGGISPGGRQPNTSAVDVENPDLGKHPRFARAPPALEGIVEPGDVLFIPKRWWHHVRSLDTSVSVNIWWR